MKTMKKLISLVLCIFILSSFLVCASAEEPKGITYTEKNYVTVMGTTDVAFAGFDASLLLVKKGTNLNSLKFEDIGYIGQREIEEDGRYIFEFDFSGFTFDNGNLVDNYEVILNVNGTNITPSIEKAEVISSLVTFDLDFSNFGRSIAQMTNAYGLKDLGYLAIVAFYDENGKLLNVKKAEKYTGDDSAFTYGYNDMPAGTATAKGFIWETNRLIPLASSGKIDVLARSVERSPMMMSLAPGINESERNFAWYDIPGVENVKIQVAEKINGTASDFDSESAKTFVGTCGKVDAAKFNGTPLNSSHPDILFNYQGEYSWGKATVTGLEAGKNYVYRIGDKFGWLKGIYEFKTDADSNSGFNFLVFSDEHFRDNNNKYNTAVKNVSDKAFEMFPDTSMVLNLGDYVNGPWNEESYMHYFSREFTNRVPIGAVLGPTHDMLIDPKEATLFGYHFNMPNQSKEYGYIKDVCGNYWYTYGDVLFIALTYNWLNQSSYDQNAPFVKAAVEANPDAKFKIVYTHLPYGGKGSASAEEEFLTTFGDYLAENGIDLVLNGHSHIHYRSHPLKDGKVVVETNTNETTDPGAPIYISLNTSGSLSYAASWIRQGYDYTAFVDTNAVYGFYSGTSYFTSDFSVVNVTTTDEECSLEFKTYQNTVQQDTFEITDTKLLDSIKIIKTLENK